MKDLMNCILKTKSIKFSPFNKPFWTKKGKLIPYSIDTNLIYGSLTNSIEMQDFIKLSFEQTNKLSIPRDIFIKVLKQYNTNKKFKKIIDASIKNIKENIGENRIDYISGVQTNDCFFSLIIAYLLEKPHISIFKNKQALITNSSFTNTIQIDDLEGARILNISDILNTSSKFSKLLIPVFTNINSELCWNFSIINNLKNSYIKLNDIHIEDYSLYSFSNIVKYANENKMISQKQYNLINSYIDKPFSTMRNFLLKNPTYFKESSNNSATSKKYANLCIENNIYKLKNNNI